MGHDISALPVPMIEVAYIRFTAFCKDRNLIYSLLKCEGYNHDCSGSGEYAYVEEETLQEARLKLSKLKCGDDYKYESTYDMIEEFLDKCLEHIKTSDIGDGCGVLVRFG